MKADKNKIGTVELTIDEMANIVDILDQILDKTEIQMKIDQRKGSLTLEKAKTIEKTVNEILKTREAFVSEINRLLSGGYGGQ